MLNDVAACKPVQNDVVDALPTPYAEVCNATSGSTSQSAAPSEQDILEDREVAHSKMIADFYFHLGFHEDAFSIYDRMRPILEDSPTLTPELLWLWASWMCSYPSPGDRQKANFSILRSTPQTRSMPHVIVQFTIAMLELDLTGENDILSDPIFWKLGNPASAIMEKLPTTNRRLHFLTFYCVDLFLRSQWTPAEIRSLEDVDIHPSRKHQSKHVDPFMLHNLKDTFVRMRPGPFELENDIMQNGCLRSSLAWCRSQLEGIVHGKNKKGLKTPGQYLARMSGTACYLFCILWECWQNDMTVAQTLSVEVRLGLDGAHLLKVVCRMIMDMKERFDPATRITISFVTFLSSMCNIIGRIQSMDDRDLAFTFLNCFTWGKHKLNHLWQRGFKGASRAYAKSLVKDTLEALATSPTSSDIVNDVRSTQDLEGDPATQHMGVYSVLSRIAMAPSIRSSNSSMASWRRMRDLTRDISRLSTSSKSTRFSVH